MVDEPYRPHAGCQIVGDHKHCEKNPLHLIWPRHDNNGVTVDGGVCASCSEVPGWTGLHWCDSGAHGESNSDLRRVVTVFYPDSDGNNVRLCAECLRKFLMLVEAP